MTGHGLLILHVYVCNSREKHTNTQHRTEIAVLIQFQLWWCMVISSIQYTLTQYAMQWKGRNGFDPPTWQASPSSSNVATQPKKEVELEVAAAVVIA